MVQFNTIPQSGLRVPGYYGEINGAQTPYVSNQRLLILGQKLSTGATPSGVATQIIGDPRDMYGVNSMMVDAIASARRNAPFQEIWGLALDDLAAGVAATGKVVVGGFPITASASISLWVGDVQVRSVAYTTDTAISFAARLVAAINAQEGCSVTAVVNGTTASEIDLTARHKGTIGNSIVIDTDYWGTEGPLAASLFTITQMAGGSGDPDFTAALAALGDEPYRFIVGPYSDSTNISAIQTWLNAVSGRWSPMQQNYGQYVGVDFSSIATQQTHASAWNEPTTSTFGAYQCASPAWVVAGALGGRIAAHLSDAPELSRPLQTLEMIGVLPPKLAANRPSITVRNTLYFAGVSSYRVQGRTMQIDRIVTHYRTNAWGSPDAVWLDLETRAIAMYSADAMKAAVSGAYPRATLMDDNPDGIDGVATPQDVKNVMIHEYKRQEGLAVVENSALFAQALVVVRSPQDPNRLDCYVPEDVANQLRIVAVNMTIFLQRN